MKFFVCALFFFLGFTNFVNAVEIREMTASELIAKQNNKDNSFLLLDVRTKAEFLQGHIQGAVLLEELEASGKIGDLKQNKEIVVYCARGGRARRYLTELKAKGFTKIYHLQGDFTGWSSHKHPVEK